MQLSVFRSIDSYFVRTVYVYIHRHQHMYGISRIPEDIKHLCLDYYLLQESFRCATNMISSNILTNTISAWNYERLGMQGKGNIIDFDDKSITKYIWYFKLLSFAYNMKPNAFIKIGLTSSMPQKLAYQRAVRYYQFMLKCDTNVGYTYCNYKEVLLYGGWVIPKIGDTIMVVFDVINTRIGYAVNDHDVVFAKTWRNRDTEYMKKKQLRMMLQIPFGAKIEFLRFQISH